MFVSPAKLYEYFGLVGIASIMVWVAVIVLLIVYARSRARTKRYWQTLGLALLGVLLANWNSGVVNGITMDQTEEIEAGRQRGEQMARTSEAPAPATTNIYEAAAKEGSTYSYRDRGKVQRTKGKKTAKTVAGVSAKKDEQPEGKMLRSKDYHRCHDLDRMNLFMARSLFWIALVLVILDYLGCYQKTLGAYCPLPIASKSFLLTRLMAWFLEAFFPKKLSVYLASSDLDRVKSFLEDVVKKGETFILFANEDPWVEGAAVPRIVIGEKRFFPLAKVVCEGKDGEPDNQFVLESAWFGRYCFVVKGREFGEQTFEELVKFLQMRQRVMASVWQTVNIVWALDGAIPETLLEESLFLCRETGYKLVVAAPNNAMLEFKPLFEEVL